MQTIITRAKDFICDENGITALEYGMLAALITMLIILSIASIGSTLQSVFSDIASVV